MFLNSDGRPAQPGEKCHRADNGRMVQTHLELQARQWSTPKGSPSGPDYARAGRKESGGDDLVTQVAKQWPSPRTEDSQCAGAHRGKPDSVNAAVRQWQTPAHHDHHIGYQDRSTGKRGTQVNVHTEVVNATAGAKEAGEQLNPEWEEILMGWPVGWTDPSRPCVGLWPGWPAGQGAFQVYYEPPRTVARGTVPQRTKRVGMVGNGVCPQQAEAAFSLLLSVQTPAGAAA